MWFQKFKFTKVPTQTLSSITELAKKQETEATSKKSPLAKTLGEFHSRILQYWVEKFERKVEDQ